MNNKKKLQIGIIVDDVKQPYLISDLYKKSLESKSYSISCLIVQKSKNTRTKNFIHRSINYLSTKGFLRFVDRIIFELIDQIETIIVKKKKDLKIFSQNNLSQNLKLRKLLLIPIFRRQA